MEIRGRGIKTSSSLKAPLMPFNTLGSNHKSCRQNPPTHPPQNSSGNWAEPGGQIQSDYPGKFNLNLQMIPRYFFLRGFGRVFHWIQSVSHNPEQTAF